ncbi:MAG: lipopolysaccharide biosynthesis protein [bacterium]|nr:lipopolysaccharide biosynthesis protein [bacterium]
MSLRRTTTIGVLWSGIQIWGSKAVSLVVFAILAHILDPEAMGLVALASVYIALLMVFGQQGFGSAIEQRLEVEDGHLDTTFWTFVVTGLVFMAITIGAAVPIARILKEPELAPILRWLSVSYLFMVLGGVQTSVLRRKLAMKTLAVRSVIAQLAGGVVGVGMALQGYGVWSLVGMQLVNGFTSTLVMWISSDWRPGFNVSRRYFRDLLPYGSSVTGSLLLDFFNRRSDDFLIAVFLGPAALGLYSVAYRLLLIMTDLLTGTATQVAVPAFAKIQGDTQKMCSVLYQAVSFTTFLAFPVFMGMAVLAPEIVAVVFGDKWSASVPVMQVLAFIGVLNAMSYYNGAVMMAMGRPNVRLIFLTINTIANVLAFYFVVRWGIVAVAAAFVVRGYLLVPMDFLFLRRLIPFSFRAYSRVLLPNILTTVIMTGAVIAFKAVASDEMPALVVLVLGIVVGVVAYALAVSLIARPALRELVKLFNLVRAR